jgi:hypothetical protein
MRQLDNTGRLVDPAQLLSERGFAIEQTVERKKDKVRGKVTKVEGALVTVQDLADSNVSLVVSISEFMKSEWVKFTAKTAPDELENWSQYGPGSSKDLHYMLVKAKIVQELKALTTKAAQKQWSECLQVFTKPKKVLAKKDIEERSLTLNPITLNIALRTDVKKGKVKEIPTSAVMIGEVVVANSAHPAVTAWLNPCFSVPAKDKDGSDSKDATQSFVNPFWVLQPTTKPDEANVSFEVHNCSGFATPVAINKCAVVKGTELRYLSSTWPGTPAPSKRTASEASLKRPDAAKVSRK